MYRANYSSPTTKENKQELVLQTAKLARSQSRKNNTNMHQVRNKFLSLRASVVARAGCIFFKSTLSPYLLRETFPPQGADIMVHVFVVVQYMQSSIYKTSWYNGQRPSRCTLYGIINFLPS